MKEMVWVSEVSYTGPVRLYTNLEDAKKRALKVLHDFYGNSEKLKHKYHVAVTELENTGSTVIKYSHK